MAVPVQDDDGAAAAAAARGAVATVETELRALVRRAKEKISDAVPFAEITKLDLSGCGLSEASLRDEFPALLPNLSVLFLSHNNFTTVPAVIGQFPKLQMVAFKSNGLESIHPDALQPQLRWLILTSNRLREIPDTIGRCTALQKFMLSGNQLTELPTALSQCTNLELVRLATNQLQAPPLHVLQLPNLRWVALADNPFLRDNSARDYVPRHLFASDSANHIRVIDGIDESQGEVLGSGAGGVTRKLDFEGRAVAVKVYSGDGITSDGRPQSERQVSLAASSLLQSNNNGTATTALVRVLGECRGTGSLVMEYLENYTALALPPSLETCTRDVYDHFYNTNDNDNNNQQQPQPPLSGKEAVHLVTVLLDALQQLHAVNITHGDFYGHNILIKRNHHDENNNSNANTNNPPNVRLSDFGAAFFYDPTAPYGQLLETVELRAYAVLVEEVAALLSLHHDSAAEASAVKSHLEALREACLRDGATLRQVDVWWKQRQLKVMATSFGVDDV